MMALGCNRRDANAGKVFSEITPGMTVTTVESKLGRGTEVGYEQLPQQYIGVLDSLSSDTPASKGDGVVYRRWTREQGNSKANGYIAFNDGRVVNGTVYVESIETRTE